MTERSTRLAAVVLSLALGAALSSLASTGGTKIFSPQASPYGKSYAEWAACWWQWAFSVPAVHNPLIDDRGSDAGWNQSGPVWFLCGIINDTGEAERTIYVPSGKALFFPVMNFIWISTEPTDPQTAAGLRDLLHPVTDAITDLACEIDNVPVRDLTQYRAESPVFHLKLAQGNLFGLPQGTYGPAMDMGYYLMLAPLSSGRHTIHFHASVPREIPPYWSPFTLDITYHITVGPTPIIVRGQGGRPARSPFR